VLLVKIFKYSKLDMDVRRVVLFGDSLTAHSLDGGGWGESLCKLYSTKADVVNRGGSGYNSRWGAQLSKEVFCKEIDDGHCLAIVWFGANDAVLASSGSKQYVPVEEYGQNLSKIINNILQVYHERGCVVVLTPPPVDERMRLEHQKKKYGEQATGILERTLDNTALYAIECLDIVKEKCDSRVCYVDVFSIMESHNDYEISDFLSDGLHLSPLGNRIVFEHVLQVIEQKLCSFAPGALKTILPPNETLSTFPCKDEVEKLCLTENGNWTVFRNGSFWDWNTLSFKNWDSVVSCNGKIVKIYEDAPQSCELANCQVQDLEGGFVLPGLADAHIHVYHMGENLNSLSLVGCKSVSELVSRVKKYAEDHPEREWIVGMGWDHELMGGILPTRFDLDTAAPTGKKIFLWRVCFHIGVANTQALETCGVSLKAPVQTVEGGQIDVMKDGQTSGVLREQAVELLTGMIAETNVQTQTKYIEDGLRQCLESGLASVQTNDKGTFDIYKKLDLENRLPLRVYLTPCHTELTAPVFSESGMFGCDRVKVFADGALGSNTAALREGDDKVKGILIYPQEKLDAIVNHANRMDLRVEAHAIGDAAAESVLNAFQKAGITKSDRAVLTHCQVLAEDIIARMAMMGVIANVQPSFVPTDATWVKNRLEPSKLEHAYCWKTLLEAGVQVAGGSDAPVESCNPLQGIYDAIFRPSSQARNVGDVFQANQMLSFPQALHLYTRGAHYASRMETRRGRIEVGFDADFTVVDKNVAAQPNLLLQANVTRVYVDGEKRYSGNKTTKDVARNSGPYAPGKGGDPLLNCRCPH